VLKLFVTAVAAVAVLLCVTSSYDQSTAVTLKLNTLQLLDSYRTGSYLFKLSLYHLRAGISDSELLAVTPAPSAGLVLEHLCQTGHHLSVRAAA
jgi:hypothetical protein